MLLILVEMWQTAGIIPLKQQFLEKRGGGGGGGHGSGCYASHEEQRHMKLI